VRTEERLSKVRTETPMDTLERLYAHAIVLDDFSLPESRETTATKAIAAAMAELCRAVGMMALR